MNVPYNKYAATWLQLYVIRHVILLQTETEKKYEVSQTFKKNTELSKSTTKFPPSFKNGDTKNHGLDYFTETNLPKASN
jgi:hypothetical protein